MSNSPFTVMYLRLILQRHKAAPLFDGLHQYNEQEAGV